MLAQKTSGTVTGQVTDPSGASVPNATVNLINKATATNRTVHTNGSGEYTFTDVQIGTYEVDVVSPSFRKQVTQGVVVNVDNVTTADAHLVTGDVSESVTVTSSTVQVQTEDASVGGIVDGTQVKELPLNGRSFVQLTQLQPGISPANNFDSKNKGLQAGVDFSVNGNPTTNNLYLIDGANNNDVGSNRTILIYPSIDAIAEFKMLTNSYGPEYGQASGAIISIATRQGTNTIHGSAFYQGRNDALASYTYFSRRNAGTGAPLNGKDKLRRNDFGYSIGGPILKDKLFGFFNQEFNRTISGFTKSACVATAAEQAGDFTQTYGAVSGNAGQLSSGCNEPQPTFANGSHRLATVDKAGALLAQYYPTPNKALSAADNNWSVSLPTFVKYRQENVRVDYNVTPRNTVMGRYTQDSWADPSYNGNQYWGDSDFPAINTNWAQPAKSVVGRWTSTISNTLVNDAEFSYSNNRINLTPGGTNSGLIQQLNAAIPTLYPASIKNNKAGSIPTVWGGLGNYGSGQSIWTIAPWNNLENLYNFRDDISKVAGKHQLKAGLLLGWNQKDEDISTSASEHPNFGTSDSNIDTTAGGFRTGNNLANVLIPNNPFLLGEPSTNVRALLDWRDYEFYVGDVWKITPRVTLSYGFRWSFLRTPYQPNGAETSFQPSLYDRTKPASDACNGLTYVPGKPSPCTAANTQFGTAFSAGVPGPNKYLVKQNNHEIAPRVGLAFDVLGNGMTALRIGGGEFYQRERVSRYTLEQNAPFAVNTSNYSRALTGATPASLAGGSASPSGGFDTADTIPSTWQYNVAVEQQLMKNTTVQVGYVSNRGRHLTSNYDINSITPNNWQLSTFTSGGAQQALRPYSNFGTLAWWSHNGDSNYNSLQTAFRTQLAGFRFQAAYTWSHGLADVLTDNSDGGNGTGVQSFTYYPDPSLDKGNAATNRPDFFVANGTYLLPRLQGRTNLVQQTLGGWEVTGITTAASGNSFSIYQAGLGENTGAVPTGLTSQALVNGALVSYGAGSVNSLFQSGLTASQRPLLAQGQTCNSGNISGAQVINANAFTLIGYHLGTYEPGMAPRGACHGPRLVNTDLSLDKNWRVHDRFNVQFRMDAFDLLNHANFRADQGNFTPVSSVNCGPQNQRLTAAQGGGLGYAPCSPTNNIVTNQVAGQNFGRSTGVNGNAQRQFQYGLHIEF
ncbi:carboxypeptidase regulatory-like domain-containing protein [Terriglobus sp.]|uniref:TonB-dependent receptor n=1 Tax=Terriglobus sp. TaxID=1889013 RepID=UPI003B00A124